MDRDSNNTLVPVVRKNPTPRLNLIPMPKKLLFWTRKA